MREAYLKFYQAPKPSALLRYQFDKVFARSPLKRVSLENRYKDYQQLLAQNNATLWELHKKINNILIKQVNAYDSYDYGEGYFYQSFQDLNISGFRNTEDRVEKLELLRRLKGKKIIDVGCNSGFVLSEVAPAIKSGFGFDINPYLIEVAELVRDVKELENLSYETTDFESLKCGKKFDVVLSLANHSTYDNNTKQTLNSYFQKCSDLLSAKGELIFESHPPELEDETKIEKVLDEIKKYFDIKEVKKFDFNSFLDKNRTYVFAVKK